MDLRTRYLGLARLAAVVVPLVVAAAVGALRDSITAATAVLVARARRRRLRRGRGPGLGAARGGVERHLVRLLPHRAVLPLRGRRPRRPRGRGAARPGRRRRRPSWRCGDCASRPGRAGGPATSTASSRRQRSRRARQGRPPRRSVGSPTASRPSWASTAVATCRTPRPGTAPRSSSGTARCGEATWCSRSTRTASRPTRRSASSWAGRMTDGVTCASRRPAGWRGPPSRSVGWPCCSLTTSRHLRHPTRVADVRPFRSHGRGRRRSGSMGP